MVTYFFILNPKEKPLPIINPVDVNPEMVDSSISRKGFGHTIGDFSFTDQNGKEFSSNEMTGKVCVVEYFFTTCGTICPKMNEQMMRIHNEFKTNPNVLMLSFTVDPETDTVEQMKRYADGHGADAKQWRFLTGKKEALYHVARTSFFVLKPAEAENQGDAGSDFIHTNNFVLIDQKKQIRGYYDGTSPTEVDQLMHDINRLISNE